MIENFPAVDPIPLPAPVWLFKLLHVLTLGLHFVAVQMLLGGLLVAVILSFLAGRSTGSQKACRLTLAAILARRLPVVMTFVINLGVPPLLFAQVLYGRALYSSSVLIGAWWISVIPVLILCYWLMYVFTQRIEAKKSAWWAGLIAWLLAACIAKVYTMNMTLMLRPETWSALYQASASGTSLPLGDPTVTPRWLTMMSGGLMAAGLWMIWLAPSRNFAAETKAALQKLGGRLAGVFAIAYAACGWWVFTRQPLDVAEGLVATPVYKISGFLWLGLLAVVVLMGIAAGSGKVPAQGLCRWAAGLVGLVLTLAMTVFRDGIRDLTLAAVGFDLWGQAVAPNWQVVIIFLVLFVVGLAVIGWLISVVVRAKPLTEEVAV